MMAPSVGVAPQEKLVVFTRYPRPGRTKTRLIPALGAAGAAELHRRMAEHTFRRCCELAPARNVAIEVHYDGGRQREVRRWVPAGLGLTPQIAGSLGDRLAHGVSASFAEGMARVVVIGTDCPALDAAMLARSFELLLEHDLVLGPARDGGCYLIGLRRPDCFAWRDVDWGTERVLGQTLASAAKKGASRILLPPLADIDRPEDLPILAAMPAGLHFFPSTDA
jgi:hypothetical protein